MRVLCKIAGELRVYLVSTAYNIDSINNESGLVENNIVFECLDGDRTFLLIKVHKDVGNSYIRKLYTDGVLKLDHRDDIIVESNLLSSLLDTIYDERLEDSLDDAWESMEEEDGNKEQY